MDPEDVQLLVMDLQKLFSKSIIELYDKGVITIDTASFADVSLEILSQVMAKNRIKKALRPTLK